MPGQASELPVAPGLLAAATALGAIGRVVPAHPTHLPVAYDRGAYRRRHRVENLSARLKEWRAPATRYDKTAASFLGGLHPAAALDWLTNKP